MYISTYLLSVAAFQTIVLAIPAEHAWATEDPWNPDDPYTTSPTTTTTTTPSPPSSTCPAAVTIGGSGSCANTNNDASQCDSAAARACCRLTECSGYLINYDTMQWTLLSSKAGCDFYDAAKSLKTGNTLAISKPDCATFPVPNTSTTIDDVPWALSVSPPTATSSPVAVAPSASCNPVAIQSASCRISCYNEASSACCNSARCSAYLIDFQSSNYTLYSMASGCGSNALPTPRVGVVPFSKNFCQASTSVTSLSKQANDTSTDREVVEVQAGSNLETNTNVTAETDENQYNVTTNGGDQDFYTNNLDETDVVLSQLYKSTAVSHNPLKPRAGDYAPTISSAEWNCKVLEAPKNTVVVTLLDMESSLYFKQFKAVLNATAYQNRSPDSKNWAFQFYSLDVKDDVSVNIARDSEIQHLPTWVFWQDGQEVSGIGGLSQKNNRVKTWDGFENFLNNYYKAFGITPVSYKQLFPQGGPA